jgi:hypothetical protein
MISGLTGRNDNPICCTGPSDYIGWWNRFLGSLNVYKYGLCLRASRNCLALLADSRRKKHKKEGIQFSRNGISFLFELILQTLFIAGGLYCCLYNFYIGFNYWDFDQNLAKIVSIFHANFVLKRNLQ